MIDTKQSLEKQNQSNNNVYSRRLFFCSPNWLWYVLYACIVKTILLQTGLPSTVSQVFGMNHPAMESSFGGASSTNCTTHPSGSRPGVHGKISSTWTAVEFSCSAIF